MNIDRRSCIAGLSGLVLPSPNTRAVSSRIDPPFRLADERKGGARIYLLGGAAPKDPSWLTPKIRKAIEECDVLWQEDPPTPAVFNEKLNIELSLRESGELFDDLSGAEKARVLKAADALGLPLDNLRKMKPWGAGAVVAYAHSSRQKSTPPPESGQQILQDIALARGIPVKAEVETWDDWVRFYASFPHKAAIQYLLYQIDIAELPPDAFERWSDSWLRGDEADWERFNKRWRMSYPDLYQVLEAGRNERWAGRIGQMAASGGTHLINVGVQHVVGPASIQVFARRRGVQFRRI